MRRYLVRTIGENRGRPRVYLDLADLAEAGFSPGKTYNRAVDEKARRVTLTAAANGSYVVSRKEREGKELPVIDLHSSELLKPFEGMEAVRIVIADNTIHVLPLASEARRLARLKRLDEHLAERSVTTAATSFGGGILDHAAHAGLKGAGINAHLAMANEIDEGLLEHAREHNDVITRDTILAAAPMQELVQDDWAMHRLPQVDVCCAGIPCSGASKAGKARRGAGLMEDHPQVGHLVASAIMLVQRMNPAVAVIENVVDYSTSGSAQILRQHLRDSGYDVQEVRLNAKDFGMLEHRERWFLVAATRGIEVDLSNLVPTLKPVRTVRDILEPIPQDSDEWRTFQYLLDKRQRDESRGNNFKLQVVTADSSQVPVLRAGYNKAGSTDPLLEHPTVPTLRRLFTVKEHARIKEVPEHLVDGLGRVQGHRLLGQSVAYTVVKALFQRIGESLVRWAKTSGGAVPQHVPYSLRLATG